MSSNGEIIHVHIGQAGVQIANACWELYCLEHGINQYGSLYDHSVNNSFQTFFAYSSTLKLVPRVVMVDSEPTVIDEVRNGTYGTLFKPQTLINGKEDSGSNFARGYNTLATELIDLTMDSLRTVVESCSNLKGFLIFRSIGGGTGSGLGNRIMEEISNDYGKMSKMDFVIFPSPSITPLIVEPYNSLLATHTGMDSSDCTFILDNEALYDVCETKLGVYSPTYTNLNRIIAQVISTLTASQRFFGSLNVSFTEFQTNLVPFPRIHFPLVSYSPLVAMGNACYTELSTEHMTFDCFQPSNQFIRCNPVKGKYMSCVLLYRGNVASSDINNSIRIIKSRGSLNFVDWSPTGFKIGINSMPPCAVYGGDIGPTDRAMMALSNNTAIQRAWCRMLSKYMSLFNRKAFLHHFIDEGLEESTFQEASEDICSLISDYREVENLSDVTGISKTGDIKSGESHSWQQRFKVFDESAQRNKEYESNDGNCIRFSRRETQECFITEILTYKKQCIPKQSSAINTIVMSEQEGRVNLQLNLKSDCLAFKTFPCQEYLAEEVQKPKQFIIKDRVRSLLQSLLESLQNEKVNCSFFNTNEKDSYMSSSSVSKQIAQNDFFASEMNFKHAEDHNIGKLNKPCKSLRSKIPVLKK